MDNQVVHAPVSVLLNPDQAASTKVVWMAMRLHPAAGPAELEARTGLSRRTVLSGLARAAGWSRTPGGPRARVPAALLADRSVGARAKVLYGLLQVTPNFKGQAGQFSYSTLCSVTQLGRNTLKRAMADLVRAGWVQVTQKSRLSPIKFSLDTPDHRRSLEEAALVERRLKRARYGGEAIMQEFLSLLIDSEQFTDNARPGFLVNPLTGERLELDRFYQPNIAFEFHGTQHGRATERFSQEEVDAQRLRDLIKAGLCLYQGLELVIIHAGDLSLQGMTRKIGQTMPLRNLAGHEPLIALLEEASLRCRAQADLSNDG